MKRINHTEFKFYDLPAAVSTVQLSEGQFETMVLWRNGDELGSVQTTTEKHARATHDEAVAIWCGAKTLDTFSFSTVQIGDYVAQDVVDWFMDMLPPACMTAQCSQIGEASDHVPDKNGRWRATYETFKHVAGPRWRGIWMYCGQCFRGESVLPEIQR